LISKGSAQTLPGEAGRCGAPPGNRSSVRFSFLGAAEGIEELLGVVGLEQEDQQLLGGAGAVADDLAAVVDRFGVSHDGDAAGLLFEVQGEDLLDLEKRLSVRFRDPESVVMEFARDAGLVGDPQDEAEFAVGGEERLLTFREPLGHGILRLR